MSGTEKAGKQCLLEEEFHSQVPDWTEADLKLLRIN